MNRDDDQPLVEPHPHLVETIRAGIEALKLRNGRALTTTTGDGDASKTNGSDGAARAAAETAGHDAQKAG